MTVWIDSNFHTSRLVQPFIPENVNPASIDLTLDATYIDLRDGERKAIGDYLDIWPGVAILASTVEYVSLPDNCAGFVMLKSSAARKGLDHALAGWVDPGFQGNLTLELHAHRPVRLTPGERLVQMAVFWCQGVPIRTYAQTGRYQGQVGPTEAR